MRKQKRVRQRPRCDGLRHLHFCRGMIVETRWFTVAPEHFEQFKKDLTAQTLVESETADGKARKKNCERRAIDPSAVKVVILPANDR